MATYNDVSMEPAQFLSGSVNVLHAAFLGASRSQAKRHFARIQGGNVLDVAPMRLPDGSSVLFKVAFDYSEFKGKMTFTTFRRALNVLVGRIVERIRLKKEITMFTADSGAILFNVPAVINLEGNTNVFALGMDKPEEGELTLRLQFLDPEQFKVENKPA